MESLKTSFDEIMASNDECIIVVSHGDLLSVWNTMFLGMDVETLNQFELLVWQAAFLSCFKTMRVSDLSRK